MLLTGLKLVCAMTLALIGSGATYQHIGTKLDEQSYLPIGKRIDVGGYNLHMIDQGVGGPTVVIDSGVKCNCLDWLFVQPEIAKFTRVITYDRAGYAWSDESPLHRTSVNIVEELRTMLKNADVPGPYILVGHSFGGHNMHLFAMMYPEEVAGLVLIDAVHPNLLEYIELPAIEYFQLMIGAAYVGIFRLLVNIPGMRECIDKQAQKYPIEMQNIYYAHNITAKFVHTVTAEAFFAKESCEQLQQFGDSLGDIPLHVISAGKPLMDHEQVKSIYSFERVEEINNRWFDLQVDLVKRSSKGKHTIAEQSSHMIPADQPEVIVQVVYDMINELAYKCSSQGYRQTI